MPDDDNSNSNEDRQVLMSFELDESVAKSIEEEAKIRGVSEDDVMNERLTRTLIFIQVLQQLGSVMNPENKPLRELVEQTDDLDKIERIGAAHGEAIVKQLKAKYHID